MATTKPLPINAEWVQTEPSPDIRMTCTRFVDPANNSDKYRWFFTVMPGPTAPHNALPVIFTQTGRWTHMHNVLNPLTAIHAGQMKYMGTVARTSYARYRNDHEGLHRAVVSRKIGNYTRASENAAAPQVLSRILQRTGHTYMPRASTPAPVPTPLAPAPVPTADKDALTGARAFSEKLHRTESLVAGTATVRVSAQKISIGEIDHFEGLALAAELRRGIDHVRQQLDILAAAASELYAASLDKELS